MKKYIYILIAFLSFENLFAQNIHTGYHSNAFILKINSNASAFPESNFVMGVPALTNSSFGIQWPFSLNQVLVKGTDDSLRIDIPSVIKNIEKGEGLFMQARHQLMFLGAKLGENIFTYVGDEIVSNLDIVLSGDLLNYISQGNAYYLNQQMNFNDERFHANAYNSFYFGASFKPSETFSFGGRFKILNGIANVKTDNINISFFTDSTSSPVFQTMIDANLMVQTSGQGIIDDSLSFDPILNNGFAFDFGLTYQLNDKLQLSLSMNDIGTINWAKKNNINYSTDGNVSYQIDGVVYSSSGNNDLESQLEEIVDSLSSVFALSESTISYSTKLKSNLFVGAKYNLTDKHSFSFLFHSREHIINRFNVLSLGYQFKAFNFLELLASYQNLNGLNNIGAGFVFSPGTFQMHFIIDNTMFADVFDAKNFALQFGLNFRFGRNDKKLR